ncbi:LacI family transcriptional regulator, partial [Streptomyces sp. NPDC060198]
IDEATRPGAEPDDPGRPGSSHPQDRVVAHRLVLRESTEGAAVREGVW